MGNICLRTKRVAFGNMLWPCILLFRSLINLDLTKWSGCLKNSSDTINSVKAFLCNFLLRISSTKQNSWLLLRPMNFSTPSDWSIWCFGRSYLHRQNKIWMFRNKLQYWEQNSFSKIFLILKRFSVKKLLWKIWYENWLCWM